MQEYLRSLVDVTVEHTAFTDMKQRSGESALLFHARLKQKICLIGYTEADQDKAVHTQLLKGMRDKELAKSARTLGYPTSFVVQCATREEAYTAESEQPGPSHTFAVQRNGRQTSNRSQWKREREMINDGGNQRNKRDSSDSMNRGQARRSRCSKCNMLFHKYGTCPAEKNNCRSCGKRGHFEVVCWKKVANTVQAERSLSPGWTKEEDEGKKWTPCRLSGGIFKPNSFSDRLGVGCQYYWRQ
ncbi:uncharacterized protein LOC129723128 [Wyeomyia smithii]|uniref:uncharacterized protein LOC129723128 n=1 Tax=Wyeomyia smithii TaxID=174621 RepID=UPI002467F5BC|nr:uncharacterized protein LOC129723128 [Wyeomyia smithii]